MTRAELSRQLGHAAGDTASRGLDAAISRLRNKVIAEGGAALPLQTIQGTGFVFSGPLRLTRHGFQRRVKGGALACPE